MARSNRNIYQLPSRGYSLCLCQWHGHQSEHKPPVDFLHILIQMNKHTNEWMSTNQVILEKATYSKERAFA